MSEIPEPIWQSGQRSAETPGEPPDGPAEEPPITMTEFLVQVPPGVVVEVLLGRLVPNSNGTKLIVPEISLYCDSDSCRGTRLFASDYDSWIGGEPSDIFLTYWCQNCRKTSKTFAFRAARKAPAFKGSAVKFGEIPAFGPPVPPRVLSLIGPDRDIFLKGRRAENQGLGVGAFAYYRRVVENQKGRLLEQIIKVAKQLGAPEADIAHLERAKGETQFSKAVEDAKDAIPDVLKVRGHNPLTLLHGPLSEGLHDLSDEECLEMATDVRVVLHELADRIAQALKDEQEVSQAVSRLLARRKK